MQLQPKTEIVSKVLSPALRLWLRSQVDSVEELKFQIFGRNREILRGYIPKVSLIGSETIYQGLHLQEVKAIAENIRINIGQILKGKPLQLLEPVVCTGEIRLQEADLNASLSSSLLANAFTDLLLMLLKTNGYTEPNLILEKYRLGWENISFDVNSFTLTGRLLDAQGSSDAITIRAGITLSDRRFLLFYPLKIESQLFPVNLKELKIDLGEDANLETLVIQEGQLFCCGSAVVRS
jgi:hypothetical protein